MHSLRTVLGMLGVGLLRFAATAFRVLGTVCRGLSRGLASFYDVLAGLPAVALGQFSRGEPAKQKTETAFPPRPEGVQGL